MVTDFNDTHLARMSGCLAITNLELALRLNFKSARLGYKRIVRTSERTNLVDRGWRGFVG